MTKRQKLDECRRLAPDFRIAFVQGDVDSIVASFTDRAGLPPLHIGMPLGADGRAAIESRLLDAALGRLRRSKAA